jgi:co-chaperonin GroES (HSP10)
MSNIKCKDVIPLHDHIIVSDMNFAEQVTQAGLIIGSDNGKSEGIKPRWAKVFTVGKDQHKIKPGDWILIEHGRWTRGAKVELASGTIAEIRRVENKSIMMVSDEKPNDVYLGYSNKSTTQTFDFSKPMF